MPLTFRDRDGRKTTRFQVTVDLTVHEVVHIVACASEGGLIDLSKITSDQGLRYVVESTLLAALRNGPQPLVPVESSAEAMVVVAQHVGREQALELLRGPRVSPVEEAALNDPAVRDAIGEAKAGDRSSLVQRERPEEE